MSLHCWCLCEVDEWAWRNLSKQSWIPFDDKRQQTSSTDAICEDHSAQIITRQETVMSTFEENFVTWPWRGRRLDCVAAMEIKSSAVIRSSSAFLSPSQHFTRRHVRMISLVVPEFGNVDQSDTSPFFPCCLLSPSPKQWLGETVGALMCLCWGHQWCHQLHCHVYMTHWVPDTELFSCLLISTLTHRGATQAFRYSFIIQASVSQTCI